MLLLDGRSRAHVWRASLADQTQKLIQRGIQPGLAVILVGSDPASILYTSMKERASGAIGFTSRKIVLPATTTTEDVIHAIERLNQDTSIHGILIQLPLPEHVDTDVVLSALDPAKDVDGLHPHNLGDLLIGRERIVPATPKGILRLLTDYVIPTEGQHVVIVGRSNILGKPLAALFLNRNATVTVCHSKTVGLAHLTRQADIIVMDTGVPGLLTGDMVKEGVVVVDAGISRLPSGDLVGDIDFDEVAHHAQAITPVPGGVGPMTIAALLENTLHLAGGI